MSSSKSYILAQYESETRKLQGDWTNDTYSNLIEKVRLKFHIRPDTQIDIKVYDKNNNKYFIIDAAEMVEIPHAGLIKISKSRIQTQTKAKTKPKLSAEEENALRQKWKINSAVELYSDSMQKWIKGKIIGIINDNEGEWLRVRYLKNREKEIQRLNKFIRPIVPTVKTSMVKPQIQIEIKQAEIEEKVEKDDTPGTPMTPSSSESTSTVEKENIILTKFNYNLDAAPFVPASVAATETASAPMIEVAKKDVVQDDTEKNQQDHHEIIEQVKKVKQVQDFTPRKKQPKNNFNQNYMNYPWQYAQKMQLQKGQYRMVRVRGRHRGKSRDKIVANVQQALPTYSSDRYYYRTRARDRRRRRSAANYANYDYEKYYERYPAPAPVPTVEIPVISENVCWEFNTIGGCSRGADCQWKHVYVGPPKAGTQNRQSRRLVRGVFGGGGGVGGVEYNYGKFGTSGSYNICWEFNTMAGCPRGINCQWHHQYLQ